MRRPRLQGRTIAVLAVSALALVMVAGNIWAQNGSQDSWGRTRTQQQSQQNQQYQQDLRTQQQDSQYQQRDQQSQQQGRMQQQTYRPRLVQANDLIGQDVQDRQGQTLGQIDDIVLNASLDKVSYVALQRGGVLGIGAEMYAIPWSALQIDASNNEIQQITVDIAEQELEQAQGFSSNNWPDQGNQQWEQQDQFQQEQFGFEEQDQFQQQQRQQQQRQQGQFQQQQDPNTPPRSATRRNGMNGRQDANTQSRLQSQSSRNGQQSQMDQQYGYEDEETADANQDRRQDQEHRKDQDRRRDQEHRQDPNAQSRIQTNQRDQMDQQYGYEGQEDWADESEWNAQTQRNQQRPTAQQRSRQQNQYNQQQTQQDWRSDSRSPQPDMSRQQQYGRQQTGQQQTRQQQLTREQFSFRRATELIGMDVQGSDQQNLGEIEDIVIDLREGRPVYSFVSYGGTLGVGQRMAVVPWQSLDIQPDEEIALLDADAQALQAVSFREGSPPDLTRMANAQRVHTQFNEQPYWETYGYEGNGLRRQPRQQSQQDRMQPGAQRGQQFDTQAQQRTYRGEILSVGTARSEQESDKSLRLRVRTDQGQTFVVHAGSREDARQQGICLYPGDQIQFQGSMATIGGHNVIKASQLKIQDKTLNLRDQQSNTQWDTQSQQRRQQGTQRNQQQDQQSQQRQNQGRNSMQNR